MKIYEYQAKELFGSFGIAVPDGVAVKTAAEAVEAARKLGGGSFVLKAQIHAGGRGKAGGIVTARGEAEISLLASRLLGSRLVTPQTAPEGLPVDVLLVEPSLDVDRELYLAVLIDRSRACPVVMATGEGGVDVEQLAAESPEKMIREWVDPCVGLRPFQINRLVFSLRLPARLVSPCRDMVANLYRFFIEKDCSHVEVNPLAITRQGALYALDAKVIFDDNALFRHPEIRGLRDTSQEDDLEVQASVQGLNYIKLKGDVGCMVNGAGLAMATMDLIKMAGGEPANFLDVGGGATEDMIREGMKILLSDRDVRVVFVNIFGGILRCDTLARGVVGALTDLSVHLPVAVRMEGTNVEEGRHILALSGFNFQMAADMREAADIITRLRKAADGG